MIKLRIKPSVRVFRCDVAGCRNRTNYLISKRDDVASRPLHLCASCIRGIYGLLKELEPQEAPAAEVPAEETVPAEVPAEETAPAEKAGTEINTVIINTGDTVNVGDRGTAEKKTRSTGGKKRRSE